MHYNNGTVICKYFLQGNCRFGDRCHYLHEDQSYKQHNRRNYENNYNFQQTSTPIQQHRYNSYNYSSQNQQQSYNHYNNHSNNDKYRVDRRSQKKNNTDTAVNITSSLLLENVRSNLTECKTGGVWPLSVYCPYFGYPHLPGLEDYSPEEIRHQYYEACRNNTIPQFDRELKCLLNETERVVQSYFSNTAEALRLLDDMIEKQSSAKNFSGQSTLANNAVASTFTFNSNRLQQPNNNTSIFNTKHTASVFQSQPQFQNTNHETKAFNTFSFNNVQAPVTNINQQSQFESFSFNKQHNANSNQPMFIEFQETTPSLFASVPEKSDVYSDMDMMLDTHLEQFNAQTFNLGQIPIISPAQNMC